MHETNGARLDMDRLTRSFLEQPKHPRRRTVMCHHRGRVYGPRSGMATPEPGFESPLLGVFRTLIQFLKRDFAPMNAVCERAEVFENPANLDLGASHPHRLPTGTVVPRCPALSLCAMRTSGRTSL